MFAYTSSDIQQGQHSHSQITLKKNICHFLNTHYNAYRSDYIRTHEKQVPAPFVILARELPMALLYDPAMLDLADSVPVWCGVVRCSAVCCSRVVQYGTVW